VIHSAEDEPAGKPDPGIFRTTAQLLGVEPARCVVFEDAPAGVRAAKAAGMTCVAVPETHDVTGGGAGASDAGHAGLGGADLVLGSLADLDDAVLSGLVQPGLVLPGLVLPGRDAGHAPPPPRRRRISGT
jgi:beta-phosphoglucomutase-like phosphatase (HAD superfamily)